MSQYLYDPNNPPAPEIAAKLRALGVRFVLATARPSAEGMVAEERSAIQDGDVWRQVWELVADTRPDPIIELRERMVLTDVQLVTILTMEGLITVVEAEAWVASGTLPPVVLSAVATLPAGQRAYARIKFRARAFRRNDPAIALLRAALNVTVQRVDNLFAQGADI